MAGWGLGAHCILGIATQALLSTFAASSSPDKDTDQRMYPFTAMSTEFFFLVTGWPNPDLNLQPQPSPVT